jgi:hypothetical protein
MKFAKILLASAMLIPAVASAQPVTPAPVVVAAPGGLLGATNFAFLLPLASFVVLPLALGEGDDVVPITPPPASNPVSTTR